jgi:hypothetical protein
MKKSNIKYEEAIYPAKLVKCCAFACDYLSFDIDSIQRVRVIRFAWEQSPNTILGIFHIGLN